jgi:hypothetical protein
MATHEPAELRRAAQMVGEALREVRPALSAAA